jgi:hypothetical protein
MSFFGQIITGVCIALKRNIIVHKIFEMAQSNYFGLSVFQKRRLDHSHTNFSYKAFAISKTIEGYTKLQRARCAKKTVLR